MSNANDPVTWLLDRAYELKSESHKVINKTVDYVSDSEAYRYVEKVVKGAKVPSLGGAAAAPPPPPSLWDRTANWIERHKWFVGIMAVGATSGTLIYMFYIRPKNGSIKRRARRAPNGSRKEVVVIAGSPSEPITRILASDFDRRGFIVYWTASSAEEEAMVKREDSMDIRPLMIKTSDESSISDTGRRLDEILKTPVVAFQGAEPHMLSLAGVVVVPDLYFPTGPVESIRADTWSDLIYSKILGPIFLLSNGLLDVVRKHRSRILLLSPTIMGSLNPAFHAGECMTANALDSLALCLHRELKPQGIPFVHMRLGSFAISPSRGSISSQERQITNSIRADILSWPDHIRNLYASPYQASSHLQTARVTGSSLRVLNNSVFDALTHPNPSRVWYVGKGSYAYRYLTSLMPESIMSWLLQPAHEKIQMMDHDWETL
ncbi:hypothetical protein TRICI_005426 [Trichomonascus ciferrii]|uniref:DUF1776-domain-containing protein n=1 Tax=Trichomonascus ciferrii TaxID=44093 RepID=A0A642UUK5_9ASCO|nr:hypothetical protein TRICI_005426 [Trichomonascus ciferrii]